MQFLGKYNVFLEKFGSLKKTPYLCSKFVQKMYVNDIEKGGKQNRK